MGSMQIINYAVNPINRINQKLVDFKAAKASNERIMEILNMQEETKNLKEISEIFPICFENFSVSYEDEKEVLKNINYKFEKGKKYAIVGLSGAGKSTFIKSILKYFQNYKGSIIFGNVECREIDKRSINKNISYIQQNIIIFNGSIKDNITMFEEAETKNMNEIIEQSGLREVVAHFENGLDGVLEEGGRNLSGGERQRIAIARALYKENSLLLLDEATSSLDNISAKKIEESILLNENVTGIVVTHSLDENMLKKYDEIIVLKQGEIIETGKFQELMENKNIFYSLFVAEN